jgi:phosphoribosyl 1,2-cyclic phosphodiesterase
MVSLQSGSNGNCVYVESGGIRLLIDAGLTGDLTENRLSQAGIDVQSIDGVLITHDHADHVKCAGVLRRKFQLPIWLTAKTYERAIQKYSIGQVNDVNFFTAGERIIFGNIAVETIPTPHDAVDGVCFVIDDGSKRLGIMTDLGRTKPLPTDPRKISITENDNPNNNPQNTQQKLFDNIEQNDTKPSSTYSENYYEKIIATLDGLLIESNFDIELLASGSYSRELQSRIRGEGGHLSNLEAATLLKSSGKKLQWACLGHISKENNHPEIVMETHREILGQHFELHIASRYGTSDVLEL